MHARMQCTKTNSNSSNPSTRPAAAPVGCRVKPCQATKHITRKFWGLNITRMVQFKIRLNHRPRAKNKPPRQSSHAKTVLPQIQTDAVPVKYTPTWVKPDSIVALKLGVIVSRRYCNWPLVNYILDVTKLNAQIIARFLFDFSIRAANAKTPQRIVKPNQISTAGCTFLHPSCI